MSEHTLYNYYDILVQSINWLLVYYHNSSELRQIYFCCQLCFWCFVTFHCQTIRSIFYISLYFLYAHPLCPIIYELQMKETSASSVVRKSVYRFASRVDWIYHLVYVRASCIEHYVHSVIKIASLQTIIEAFIDHYLTYDCFLIKRAVRSQIHWLK